MKLVLLPAQISLGPFIGRGSVDTGSADRFPDAIADSLHRERSEKSRRRQKAAAAAADFIDDPSRDVPDALE